MNDPANSSDEALADSLSESDDAVAVLADRHAQSLYDFALRLTLNTEAAADIVRAAFAELRANASQRPDGASVRVSLFNFALVQGLDAANDRPASARLSTGDRRFTQTDPGIDREVALWAWQAARSLRPRDYAVVDLTVRRGLDPEELAGPATEGRGGIETTLRRANAGFAEAYIATALYFRGRNACADLADLVGGSGAAMRVGIRRQIVAHVEDCETCQATLESLPGASDVFVALRNVEMPADLPAQIVAGATAAAGMAAGQLSLEAGAAAAEAGVEEPSEPEAAGEVPGPEAEETGTEEIHEPEAEEPPPETGASEEPFEGETAPEGEGQQPAASEEDLWARPEVEAGFAGVAFTGLPETVSEIEERLGVGPVEPSYGPTEVYEQYGSEYAQEQPRYGGYEPAPLTLKERLSIWFEPAYGRSFVMSYAMLGVATAVAVFLGLALAGALNGGGGEEAPAVGGALVREIACETGPLTLDAGRAETFQFDPASLDGFELDSVTVAKKPVAAAANALVVEVAGATAMKADAASASSPTARRDEYGIQIIWQRGDEDAVTDCPLFVNVARSAVPSPASGTPDAEGTPEGTPGADATPQSTP